MKNVLRASFLVLSLASLPVFANQLGQERTSNDDLILAARGLKRARLLAVADKNPLLVLFAAAVQQHESNEDISSIESALANGADINHPEGYSGYTALIYAAYKGYPNMVRYLLSKGADPQIKERLGYNAYTMAQYYVRKYPDQGLCKRSHMRYQEVVDILSPITLDKTMPRTALNTPKGN